MNAQELNDLLDVVKEYQPLINACVPVVSEIGTDVYPLIEKLVDTSADLQLRFFNRLIDGGMDREEALLTLNSITSGMVKRGMSK